LYVLWLVTANSIKQSPSWEADGQVIKKFPSFYEILKFITVFKWACYWTLHLARWIQSIPSHLISSRSILVLSFHVCLPSDLFSSGFPTKILYAFLISPMCATFPTPHPSWLLTLMFGENQLQQFFFKWHWNINMQLCS